MQVENYRKPDTTQQMICFLDGQEMKKSQGKANPGQVKGLLRKKLAAQVLKANS